jgi:hypothetical protein
MAQVTEILGQLPPEAPDPLLELWKKLMAEGQGGQVAQQQGANISPAQATPQQAPTLNALLGQGMGKGLGPTQYGGGNETGLTYSGGVAGYAGAPRASDSTPVRTATYSTQAGQQAMVDTERMRNQPGPGGMSMGDLMDKIAPALKLGPAQYSAINSMGLPGISVTDPSQVRLENARAVQDRFDRNFGKLSVNQTKTLSQNETAIAAIDSFANAFEDFASKSGGAASDMLRGAIAKNANAQRVQDLVTVQGRTPEERRLAAKYNTIVGNIKQLTDEAGVLTDTDAQRILRSFDISLHPDQVRENLKARKESHSLTFNTTVDSIAKSGKDVSRYQKYELPKPAQSAPAASGGRVKVVGPDGKAYTLPPEQLAEAEKQGYKRAQ